jgi:hypothetical protein
VLRKPFFVFAVVAMLLAVLVELGTPFLLAGHDAGGALAAQAGSLGVDVPVGAGTPPGYAIGYLALVDGGLLFTVVLMGAGLVVPERIHGRVQGMATLVFSVLLLLTAIGLLVAAIARLMLMVTLLLAVPFGTIAYLIGWGFFPRGQAAALLSLLMLLKFVFAGSLLLAQQRFLQNKGLVALTLTSFACTILAAFLHGLVPLVLVSILDGVAAIVIAVVGIVWAAVLLVGSIPAVVRAAQVTLGARLPATARRRPRVRSTPGVR